MKKLETYTVQELRPGMRVASAVVDGHGVVLLPAGAELLEGTITSLQRREIVEVTVELEVEDDPAALERRRQHVKERLDWLFRNAGEGSETRGLYEAIAKYRLEHRP